MYAIHRIRPGYWIIRNTYGERVAEAETHDQALRVMWQLERGEKPRTPAPMQTGPIHDPWGLSRLD